MTQHVLFIDPSLKAGWALLKRASEGNELYYGTWLLGEAA